MPQDAVRTDSTRDAVNRPPVRGADAGLTGPPCDICGEPMLDLHCKLRCLACGFFRDCSDP